MLEEWYGNALRSVTNDPNALEEFATWDNQMMTFFSFLPMALGGAAVSALSGRKAQGRYEESVSALEKVLREMGKDDEGDDYAGTARLKDGREVTLQRTANGLVGWLDDDNVLKVTDDMIAEYLPEGDTGASVNQVGNEDLDNVTVQENGDEVISSEVPMKEDGTPDYDAMPPEMFAEEFEKEFGVDAAQSELEQMVSDIDAQVEKLRKKSPTNRNERAGNMREIARLKGEQENVRKALERYAERESNMMDEEIKPVGKGVFGNIYDQFKGKARDAINFLLKKKEGDAVGVFQRENIGDISLVWGDDKKGMQHIIKRHVIEQDDFNSIDELASSLEDVIENGDVVEHGDNMLFIKDGYKAVAVKDKSGKYVVTAYDTTRKKDEKKRSEADATRLYQSIFENGDGNLVPQNFAEKSTGIGNFSSSVKGTESFSDTQEEEGKSGSPLFREGESDRILFREVEDNDGGKSLVGIHNISEEKMMKALRQGGLANPSSAVIDVDKQTHTGYGAISLVMPSSMVDKRTGRNAGTFEGDAWTPTYPQVEKQFSEDGSKRASEDISSVPKDMQSVVRQAIDSFMDGRDARGLSYLFLHERGEAPEMIMVENKYGDKTRDAIIEATGGGFSLVNLDKDAKDKIIDVYIEENFNGNRAAYEEYLQKRIEILKNNLNHERSLVRKRAQEDLTSIEEYGFDYGAISNFVKSVGNDVRNGGKSDSQRTMLEAIKQMEERGLEKEFSEWKDGLNDRYHVEEVIFDGFTPSGNRRYVKNTLENVSKLMKKQGRAGATGFTAGFSRFAASLMKAKGSLKDIRKSKNKLTDNHADVDAFRDKWSEVFFDLGSKLQPDARGYDDYGLARLQEASTKSNPKKYIKDEYGIDFSDEDVKRLNDMVDAILNEYPAMYFETKFERPVYLNEFAAAIVPDNINANVRGALMNAGLQIFDYKEGDEQSRQAAVREASNIEGVRFRREASMDTSVDEVNRRFNEELERQIKGELPKGHVYQLGKPSWALKSAGIPNLPIELASSRLSDKSMQENHPFDLKEVKNLPEAIQNPMAVFRSATHIGSFVVMTEIEHKGKNFVVAIQTNKKKGKIEINDIRSIHYRTSNNHMTNWIDEGLLEYADKKRMSEWLSKQRYNSAEVKQLYGRATKIVENFENPTLEDGEIVSAVESLADELNIPVRIVRDVNEIKDKDAEQELKKRGSKGWYDPKTGEVVIVLPNANDVRDAKATVLHEIVGHKGIRGLFGDKLGEFTKRVLDAMPEAERKKWVDRYNGNEQLAAEEYVAQFAEGYENPGMWEKIVAIVRELLRDLGIDLKLSDADLKYTLWRGVRRMKEGSYSGEFTQSERSLFREGEEAISDGSVKKIANLMNNLKNRKASVKLTSRLLSRYARGTFDADMIGFMGKRQFDSVLRKIDEGIGGHFENISKSAAELLNERRKLVGENIRERDSERRKELNRQVKELDRQIEDIVRGELDSIFKQLADVAVKVELKKEKARFDKLTHLKVEGKNQSGVSVAKKVDEDTKLLLRFIQNHIGEDMEPFIKELNDKYSGGEMSRSDEIKMRGALVLQKYFESDNSSEFIEAYTKQKSEISGSISELKDKINEEKEKSFPDKGELSKLRKKLKSKQQELKATEEILFENRAAYLDRLRELNDDLKGFIDTGRGKFLEWVNEEQLPHYRHNLLPHARILVSLRKLSNILLRRQLLIAIIPIDPLLPFSLRHRIQNPLRELPKLVPKQATDTLMPNNLMQHRSLCISHILCIRQHNHHLARLRVIPTFGAPLLPLHIGIFVLNLIHVPHNPNRNIQIISQRFYR